MTDTSQNNKRIAKNAIFLYFRMFFSMAVSLFTSRVVLQTLGVMDYGIWNVVGGVIAMFSFLNASMAGCTNRFLSFELGRRDYVKLQQVFSSALTIHILIALIILVLGETVGLWFLREKLVIPSDRMFAANIIYQITIISSMITITQVPYNAMIMANERMNVYAYIEIANVCLKLAIVYMLYISPFDKLISYGILTFTVTLLIMISYRVYCIKKLKSCKFKLSLDRSIIKPMLSFSGWDLYGNASVMARTQGVNMLLNMFFTSVMNAASAIATSVQGAVMAFAGNVLAAFRPQIVKTYATGEYETMVDLIRKASVYTTYLLLIFTFPLLLETDYILKIWLKTPPDYAATLCRYVLLFNVIANLSSVLISGVHATGHIIRSSFINGTCYLLVIPFSYFAFKMGMKAEIAYAFNIIAVCIGMTQNLFVLSKYVTILKKRKYFFNIILKYLIVGLITYFISELVRDMLSVSFKRLCITTLTTTTLFSVMTFFFIFNVHERNFAINKFVSLKHKIHL